MEAPLRLRKGPGPTDSATAGALSSTRPASTLAAMDLGLSLTPAALGGEGAAAGAGFIPATNARNLRQTSKSNLLEVRKCPYRPIRLSQENARTS